MKILGVDTALGGCSVAVLDGDAILAHRFEVMVRGHAEALAPMVQAVMAEAGIAFDAVERLAVTTGPGTFTGQRVGIAFMRGLALALKVPCIGVTTSAVMAAEACAKTELSWALAVSDARRGEIYSAAYTRDGVCLLEPVVLLEADVTAACLALKQKAPAALAGTGVPLLQAMAAFQTPQFSDSGVRQPDALYVARLARSASVPDAQPKPLYLRPPDAKLPGGITPDPKVFNA